MLGEPNVAFGCGGRRTGHRGRELGESSTQIDLWLSPSVRSRSDGGVPRRRDIPRSLLVLAGRQGGLLSAEQADAQGVTSGRRGRLVAAGLWSRPTRGVFDTRPTSGRSPDDRRLRAAWLGMLAYGPSAVAVGACALALYGVSGLPVDLQPEIAMPGGRFRQSRDGIRVREFGGATVLPQRRIGAGRAVVLPWAVTQAVPEIGRRHALAVLDDVLRRGLLDESGLEDVRSRVAGRRGAAGVGDLWSLVDARAESPLESLARLDCWDAGVPADDVQVTIRDGDGGFVARADLGWRLGGDRWLVAEIDGREVHETPRAVLHDRRRQNAVVRTGRVELLRFTAADLGPSGALVRTVRAHLPTTWRPSTAVKPPNATSGTSDRALAHVMLRSADLGYGVGQVGVIGRGGDDDD
ncbi:type IV toxin-antitoxin system AbiEi family antitoxin domain-containing protein [Cellulomonas septica]|uniref:DUF559 domain-containing protein n=1 Tax=Cellulomonas septica TaxID=285080 RepID=A0ABX1JZ16_9CELL|nr:type IV toxin-antitoxin system AbiEi family antitoxin domain-containing protein [Cellulomonas septica]NKY39302.1 hypothetical protein [Cellulomonas septica]